MVSLFRIGCFGLISILGLSGCLFTVQHSNHGKPLAAGKQEFQLGLGLEKNQKLTCDQGAQYQYGIARAEYTTVKNSAGYITDCIDIAYITYSMESDRVVNDTAPRVDPVQSMLWKWVGGLSYRHGLADSLGVFPGLDMGIMAEIHHKNVALEYDVRLGMPLPKSWTKWSHSVSGGWIAGWWINNTWFAEYAVSRRFKDSHYLYSSYRALSLAQDNLNPPNVGWGKSLEPVGSKKIGHQGSLGYRFDPIESGWFLGGSITINKNLPSVLNIDYAHSLRSRYSFAAQLNMGVSF